MVTQKDETRGAILVLSIVVLVLGFVAAAAGLLLHGMGQSFSFTTVHGETIEIYGRGLYRNDWAFKAPIQRGTDAVTLLVALPLLLWSLALYWRGSLRGQLLLSGVLCYTLYNAVSLAFGVAYNSLALVYLLYFSSSFFALVLTLVSLDPKRLAAQVSSRVPRRGMAAFLIITGLSVFVWLIGVVEAWGTGGVPHGVAHYTTETTLFLDLGIIAPTAFLTAFLLLRGQTLAYLLAAPLLTLNALIGLVVISQTVAQSLAGISLGTTELVAYVGTFVVTSLIAGGLLLTLLRNVLEPKQDTPRYERYASQS